MQGNYLEIKGELIAVEEKIPLELNSPFFDREEKILSNGDSINPQGTIAPSFTKVADDKLKKLFGNVDLLSAKGVATEIAAVKLLSNGTLIDTGNLVIQQINKNLNNRSNKYSLQFFSGNMDDFLNAVKDKKLTDLVMNGDVAIPGGTITQWGNINPYIAGDPKIGLDLINLQVQDGPLPSPSPMTYNDVFAEISYADNAATADYATGIVTGGNDYYNFPTLIVYSGEKDGDGQPAYRVINRWSVDANFRTYSTVVKTIGNGTYTAYTQVDNPIVPMYYWKPVLMHCFSEFGYELQPDWLLEDEQFTKLQFLNTHSILRPLMVFMTNIHNQGSADHTLYYEQSTVISPKNHLPDDSITNFLSDFMIKFNCYFDVDGKKVTIKHNELSKAQREIKRIAPEIEIRTDKQGLDLNYNLSNDSYAKEKAYTKQTTTLPDVDVVAGLSNDDWYIDHETNSIYKKLTGDDELQGSNFLRYYTGAGKQYSMQYTPVNCAVINYRKVIGDVFADGVNPDAFLPFVNNDITGYSTHIFNYEYASQYGPVGSPSFVVTHDYTFMDMEGNDLTDPSSITIAGFYHGLTSNMDIIAYDPAIQFPYMSNHNYRPGAVSPKIGDWHLGIIGAEGLVDTFWKVFINIFDGRKFIMACDENHNDIKAHEWNKSVIIQGQKLYISVIRPEYPITKFPIYEVYEL